jgi:chromosome segregation ATPase
MLSYFCSNIKLINNNKEAFKGKNNINIKYNEDKKFSPKLMNKIENTYINSYNYYKNGMYIILIGAGLIISGQLLLKYYDNNKITNLETVNEELKKLKESKDKEVANMKEKDKEIEKLKKETQNLQNKIKETEAKCLESNKKIECLDKILNVAKKESTETQAKLLTLQNNKIQDGKIQEELKNTKSKLQEAKNEIQKKNDQIEINQKDIKKLEENLNAKDKEFERQNKDSIKKNKNLTDTIKTHVNETDLLNKKNNVKQENFNKHTDIINNLNNQIKELKKSEKTLQESAEEKGKLIIQLKASVEKKEEEMIVFRNLVSEQMENL